MDLAEAHATIALLQGHIAALEQLLSARDATIEALQLEAQRQQFEIARLKRMIFGDRRERVRPAELPLLPGITLAPSNDTAPAEQPPPRKRRVREHEREVPARRRGRLEVDPACVTEQHVTLPPARTVCSCCGAAMVAIGEETSTLVERIPAHYLRTITHRPKLACQQCRQGGVCIAPAPEPPVTGAGPVGTGLAVDLAVMHYADHLPFHRIAGILAREGLQIDRSTIARVCARVGGLLRPVVDAMERELLASDAVVGIDGTEIKILASERCARRTVYVRHGLGHVVFRVLRGRGAAQVLEGFETFRGVAVCDAAKVHLGTVAGELGLVVALCNAHSRRNFYDARQTDRARADHALAFFQQVARLERRWQDLDPHARQRERKSHLLPLFEAFRTWLLEERPKLWPRSPMAGAFDYALRHWDGLTRFVHDGRVPWTNNESERLLRHLVVGRKAWVFRGSFEGAVRGCVLWSLMLSCRRLGIDPRRYLLDTLEALRTTSHRRAHELTPRAYAARTAAATVAA